jgi:hypothetical protein
VKPGALEICNGIDDNCDGGPTEEGASNCLRFTATPTGTGWGRREPTGASAPPRAPGPLPGATDCNDEDVAVSPLRTEAATHRRQLRRADRRGDDRDACDRDERCTGPARGRPPAIPGSAVLHGAQPGSRILQRRGRRLQRPDRRGRRRRCTDWYMTTTATLGSPGTPGACARPRGLPGPGDRLGELQRPGRGIPRGAPRPSTARTDDCDWLDGRGGGGRGCSTLYLDLDGDSWGAVGSNKCLCPWGLPATRPRRGLDCDDQDASVKTRAAERCTAAGFPRKDEDCDGSTDEEKRHGVHEPFPGPGRGHLGQPERGEVPRQAMGEYTATRSGDCCDLDTRACRQTGWFTQVNACGSFDNDCSNTAERTVRFGQRPMHRLGHRTAACWSRAGRGPPSRTAARPGTTSRGMRLLLHRVGLLLRPRVIPADPGCH